MQAKLGKLIREENFEAVSRFLDQVDLNRMETVTKIEIVPLAHLHRDKIQNWESFSEKLYKHLKENGHNPYELIKLD